MNQIDLLKEWKNEVDLFTLELIQTISDRTIDLKPFENLRDLQTIVCHMAESEIELVSTLSQVNEITVKQPEHSEVFDVESCRRYLKQVFQYTDTILQMITDQDLPREIIISNNNAPVSVLGVIRMIIEHQVHHRGQIVVALEMLDLKVPKRWDEYTDKIQ